MEKEVKAVGRKAPIVKTNSKLKEYLRKPGSLIMLILIMFPILMQTCLHGNTIQIMFQ